MSTTAREEMKTQHEDNSPKAYGICTESKAASLSIKGHQVVNNNDSLHSGRIQNQTSCHVTKDTYPEVNYKEVNVPKHSPHQHSDRDKESYDFNVRKRLVLIPTCTQDRKILVERGRQRIVKAEPQRGSMLELQKAATTPRKATTSPEDPRELAKKNPHQDLQGIQSSLEQE